MLSKIDENIINPVSKYDKQKGKKRREKENASTNVRYAFVKEVPSRRHRKRVGLKT